MASKIHNIVSKAQQAKPSWMLAFSVQVFNPPYVPTPQEELERTDIARAWAGGLNGRVVIDVFLPFVSHALAWLCNKFQCWVARNLRTLQEI